MEKGISILLVTFEFPTHTAIGGIGAYMMHLAKLLHGFGNTVTVFSATATHTSVTSLELTYCKNYLLPASDHSSFRKQALELFTGLNGQQNFQVMESPEVGACALDIKLAFPHMPLIVKMHTPGVLITRINQTYIPVMNYLRFTLGALKRGKIDLGHWSSKAKDKHKDAEYLICEKADLLLSPSDALRRWVVKFWGLPMQKIKLLPNPFSLDDELLKLPVENRQPFICFVGKLSILKGMIGLTEALPLILDKYPLYSVYIVGRDEMEKPGGMKSWMEEKLQRYKDRIIFTGQKPADELKAIYAKSKVFIIPSLWENYPTVVLEAMAAGAAVAASARGGIPEMIDDGKTGKLFDPLKPASVFKAVDELLSDDANRIAISVNARKKLLAIQQDSKMNEGLNAIYTSVAVND